MNCSSCRFIGPPEGVFGFDETRQDLRLTEHRRCLRIIKGTGGQSFDRIRREPALAVDGDGYRAALYVLPTFCCALYESRLTYSQHES